MYALDGPRFFQLAYRLPVYEGVLRQRLLLQEQQRHQPAPATTPEETPSSNGHAAVNAGELTEDEVEQLRNTNRIRRNPGALRQGEQPQHVSLEQLLAQST